MMSETPTPHPDERAEDVSGEPADPNRVAFSVKLACYYMARKGYRPGLPDDLAPLLGNTDFALTFTDGLSLSVLLIVVGETAPGKDLSASFHDLQTLSERLSRPAGKRTVRPSIHVVEIRSGHPKSVAERWQEVGTTFSNAKEKISLTVVDPERREIISSRSGHKRFVRSVISLPMLSEAEMRRAIDVVSAPASRPLLSGLLIALLAGIFLLQVSFGVEPMRETLTPGLNTLIAFGGISLDLVLGSGDWSRMFSAMFLHADPQHILFNAVALLIGGVLLESRIGRLHFLALFIVSGIGGALGSLALNPANVVSVGASGAISGLFGAAMVVAQHYPPGPVRASIQRMAIQILIPAVLPVAFTFFGHAGHVDYGAHLGGAIAGALYGLALLPNWSHERPHPGMRPVAVLIIIAGLIGCGFAVQLGIRMHRGFQITANLPMGQAFTARRKAALAAGVPYTSRYPQDPRGHILEAVEDLGADRFPEAEMAAQRGIADPFLLTRFFSPDLLQLGEAALAASIDAQGRRDEARAIAEKICQTNTEIRAILDSRQLCDLDTKPKS